LHFWPPNPLFGQFIHLAASSRLNAAFDSSLHHPVSLAFQKSLFHKEISILFKFSALYKSI